MKIMRTLLIATVVAAVANVVVARLLRAIHRYRVGVALGVFGYPAEHRHGKGGAHLVLAVLLQKVLPRVVFLARVVHVHEKPIEGGVPALRGFWSRGVTKIGLLLLGHPCSSE